MNTYNNNLHTSIMGSLRNQELEVKSTDSKVNVSVFSLYYADDAKVNAVEKHNKANSTLLEKAAVKKMAVENSNTSTNMLTATHQEKECVDRAVNNAAVSASNVQIAATAIVKLASDIGSIFTILGAADLNSDIYQQCKEAYEKVSETAYCAEITSQHAMEASTLTSKVTADVVVDRATVTNEKVTELLKIAEQEYTHAATIVNTDNANMAKASKIATAAEGVLEKSRVYNLSAKSAYQKSNRDLNMNLSVATTAAQNGESLTVNFDFIQVPFAIPENTNKPLYPVKEYCVMLVKEKKIAVFSMSNAENVLLNSSETTPLCIKYPGAEGVVDEGVDACTIMIDRNKAFDTDGDAIALGANYAVFVLAVYETSYKKNLNNFDDYLSAPSATFILTDQLNAPSFDLANVKANHNKYNLCVIDDVLTFNVSGNNDKKVEYRCMFLPQENDAKKEALSIAARTEKLAKLELKAVEHRVEVEALSEAIKDYKMTNGAELQELLEKQEINQRMVGRWGYRYVDASVTSAEKALIRMRELALGLQSLEEDLQKETNSLDNIDDELTIIASTLEEGVEMNAKLMTAKIKRSIKPLDFFFNDTLAAHVPVGSYSIASQVVKKSKKKDGVDSMNCSCVLEPGVTDNFGNMLVEGNYYVPVVLAITKEQGQVATQYSSSLSQFNATPMFKYKA